MHESFLIGIVCYNPNSFSIFAIIDQFGSDNVIIYNNGGADFILAKYPEIKFIGNGRNAGLAEAMNDIKKLTISLGYRFLILSDQDTSYPLDYFNKMVSAFYYTDNVAAVFPAWVDSNSLDKSQKKQFVFSNFKLSQNKTVKQYSVISHGITSGMILDLVKTSNIDFDEALFIDWIDNDWCWRVFYEYKLNCVLNNDVTLLHQLGDSSVKICGRTFTARNPIRDYYIIRNATYLLLSRKNNFACKQYLLKKIIHHIIFSSLISFKNKTGYRHLFLAIKDGFISKMYKCSYDF